MTSQIKELIRLAVDDVNHGMDVSEVIERTAKSAYNFGISYGIMGAIDHMKIETIKEYADK